MPSLPDIPLASTSLLEGPLADFLPIPPKEKWDHSPSDSLNWLHAKRAHVTPPEIQVGSEHRSTQVSHHMPDLTQETRTSSRQKRQESSILSSSSIRGPADPNDEAATGSSKSTKDHTSSDLGSSKENMAHSDLGTASRDCLSCLDTDDVCMWTVKNKYGRRVRASCKLSKGSNWTEIQIKRIRDSCQDVWGHDHKIIRREQICPLVEDHTSLKWEECNKDWPAAPYNWSYQLQYLYRGVRGRDLWPSKGLGAVLETVPCPFLQALWEGDHQGNGGPPRPTF